MLSIIIRILKQIRNDLRSLGLLIIAPIFILTLLYFLLGSSNYTPEIAVTGVPDSYIVLMEKNLHVQTVTDTSTDPFSYIEEHSLDGYLQMDQNGLNLYMKEANSKTAQIKKDLSGILTGPMTFTSHFEYETTSDNQLDTLSYIFLGVLAFFFVFIFSGVSFVGERNTQTLDRMLLSPMSKFSIIGGYLLGYGLLSGMQSTLLILFAKYVLKLHFSGSVGTCVLIMILLSFSAVSFGTLLSIFAKNQFQMIQFIPIIIVPQIFFSGLIPLDTIPYGIGNLCYIFPVYYGCFALKEIIIYGYTVSDILPYLGGLLVFTLVLFMLNVFALKKAK